MDEVQKRVEVEKASCTSKDDDEMDNMVNQLQATVEGVEGLTGMLLDLFAQKAEEIKEEIAIHETSHAEKRREIHHLESELTTTRNEIKDLNDRLAEAQASAAEKEVQWKLQNKRQGQGGGWEEHKEGK